MKNLQPQIVWSHFATLCEIPRPSLKEAALRNYLIDWAQARSIKTIVDVAGNLILRKSASPGYEAMPGVILQGHLDMVCQANASTVHDFERDAIRTVVRDGWVVAEETTLGADNGIGVALALAALEDEELIHPPLEVLLTINEESGMDGARELEPGTLQGKTLINLDTEEWGHFYLGCAGGMDVELSRECELNEIPQGFVTLAFEVTGLRGGHSGIDIHLGRGNAIKLMAEALSDFSEHNDLYLIEMNGGTARNAIPREAYAVIAISGETDAEHLKEWAEHRSEVWQKRFDGVDDDVLFQCKLGGVANGKGVWREERERLSGFLDRVANGVSQLSKDFPGVTDTSSNLGVVAFKEGKFNATFKVRSLQNGRADALAEKMVSQAQVHGMQATKQGAYPGWTPNRASKLLELCQQVYTEQFGHPANLQVIHAGLECGLLAASHPHLDMISFGPDIRGAHAPGERVEIASVERCWILLKAILQQLAKA